MATKTSKKNSKVKGSSKKTQVDRIKMIMGDSRFVHCESGCGKSWMPMVALPEKLSYLRKICPFCETEKHTAVLDYLKETVVLNVAPKIKEIEAILAEFEESSEDDENFYESADELDFDNNIGSLELDTYEEMDYEAA